MLPTGEMITIYTDGSCHTQKRVGGWAAIVFSAGEKIVLSGMETNTTHNRMELTAVIKALHCVQMKFPGTGVLTIVSDSQYVTGLATRKDKLLSENFITKAGKELPNAGLLKELFALMRIFSIHFVKIKAHQKQSGAPSYNIEADKLSRKIVREAVEAASRETI